MSSKRVDLICSYIRLLHPHCVSINQLLLLPMYSVLSLSMYKKKPHSKTKSDRPRACALNVLHIVARKRNQTCAAALHNLHSIGSRVMRPNTACEISADAIICVWCVLHAELAVIILSQRWGCWSVLLLRDHTSTI